jgi:hypothetical protein
VEVVDVMERVAMEWALISAAMQHLTDVRDKRGGSNELEFN